jgi:hypothetical protein
MVAFYNGVSEVQYFSLKPGQTAKLKVEVGAVTDEITVEYLARSLAAMKSRRRQDRSNKMTQSGLLTRYYGSLTQAVG